MTTARRLHYSYEQYLDALEMSHLKLEYCDGEIYAMAGGTPVHAELAAIATSLLQQGLRGRCRVFSSDLKVRVDSTGLSTFPDVTVICGTPQFAAIDQNAAVNPSVLVEVTSASTEDYDRGDKLSHYKQLKSLQAVLFISHRTRQISLHHRVAAGWEVREFRSGELVELSEPALSISVDDVYAGVTL
jgi:Uma2 family endonuclease